MEIEDLTLGDKNSTVYEPEMYIILFINITLINSIKIKLKEKLWSDLDCGRVLFLYWKKGLALQIYPQIAPRKFKRRYQTLSPTSVVKVW